MRRRVHTRRSFQHDHPVYGQWWRSLLCFARLRVKSWRAPRVPPQRHRRDGAQLFVHEHRYETKRDDSSTRWWHKMASDSARNNDTRHLRTGRKHVAVSNRKDRGFHLVLAPHCCVTRTALVEQRNRRSDMMTESAVYQHRETSSLISSATAI